SNMADAVLDRNDSVAAPRAPLAPEEAAQARPSIDAGDLDLPRVAGLAWTALLNANQPPSLFCVGSAPSRLELADDAAFPTLRPLAEYQLRFHLARAAAWFTRTKDAPRPALPPPHVVRDTLARPAPPLPVLTRFVRAPAPPP